MDADEMTALAGQLARTPAGCHWLLRQNPEPDGRGAYFANVMRDGAVGLVSWGRPANPPGDYFKAYGPTPSEAVRLAMDAAHAALGTAVH